MNTSYVLGLDFGSDSVRAILVDTVTGRQTATSSYGYSRWSKGLYSDAATHRFRHHPLDYTEALEGVIRSITSHYPTEAAHIAALSVDTTASTPCFTDEHLQPLALRSDFAENPNAMFVLWKDHTGEHEAAQINALCQSSPINYAMYSGNRYSSECYWSKVLHILRNDEQVRLAAHSVIELCDWIPALLTGCTEVADLKMNHCCAAQKMLWDRSWGGYPPREFFEQLDPVLLPILDNMNSENYTCDHAAGTITPQWAERLGLPSTTLIGVGNVDSHSGAVGGGVCRGTLVMSFGTSAAYMSVMPVDAVTHVIDGVFGQVESSIIPEMVGFENGLSAFGDTYAWFKRVLSFPVEQILAQTDTLDAATREKLCAEVKDKIMVALNREAAKIKLTDNSPFATDYLNGRRSPAPNQRLWGSIMGLTLSSSAADLFLALVEATAFASKAIVDHLTANGVEIERIIGIGGISQKSPLVVQMLADTLDRRIDVSECDQNGALGAAMYACTVAKIYTSVEQAQHALRRPVLRSYSPDKERHVLLMRRYAKYRAATEFTEQQTFQN